MKIRFKLQLRTRILILCLSSTLLALFLQSLFFQGTASSIVYEQEKRAGLNSLKNMQNELYRLIKTYENSMIRIYDQSDFLKDMISSDSYEDLRSRYSSLAYHMALDNFSPEQNVGAIYIYDSKDRLLSSYRSANTPRYNYPEDIYDDPVKNNSGKIRQYVHGDNRTMLISSYFNESRKSSVIRFVLNIYSNNSVEKMGYLVCDVNPPGFTRIIRKYLYSDKQFVWLQPTGDRELISYGELNQKQQDFYSESIRDVQLNRQPVEETKIVGDSVFMNLPLNKYNLVTFSLTPQYLLKENQTILRKNMLIIALLVTAVTLISVTLISYSLTTPLRNMVRSLELITSGKTQVRMEIVKNDELGLLSRTINDMLDRIQDLAAQEYHLEMLLRQAEYRTLQAQVNPHFLYNSLDTMSGIAMTQNCRPVSVLCNALSNVFRYSIDMKDPLSTVDKEVIHIKNYMYIMNTRMNNSIELAIDLDQNALACPIPRLSLQPIVENAVNHGLKNKRGDKKITIKALCIGGDVILTIEDNGVGLDESKISSMIADDPEATLGLKDSIGLSNIHSRIRMLFGEPYGLTIRGGKDRGCSVTITIPLEGKKQELI